MSDEPVIVNGILTFIFAVLAPVLAKVGIDADGAKQLAAGIGAAIVAAIAIWRVWVARSKVTPVATGG